MEALATYLLKSSVWLTGFALVYALFLRNERFFTLNRIFLVSGILVSIIFPFFTFHYTVVVPVVPNSTVSEPVVQGIVVADEPFPTQNVLLALYVLGIAYLIFRILKQTLPVFRIIKQSEKHQFSSAKLIRTAEYPASFSFFSFVFVNPSISDTETNEIVNHEMEHIRQQHWIDLLLFEILRTMQWFNPAVWLYGHLIRQNHEYLADERALQRSSNPAIYRAALLNQLFGGPVISLANSFNYSLNKKRFKMMKQTINSPIRKLKFLFVLPLIAGVFYAFAAPEYSFIQTGQAVINLTQTEKTIKGQVVSENGKPLKGASVIISGKTIGTVTDAKGNFELKMTDNSLLVVSYVGFETVEINPYFAKELKVILKRKTFLINSEKDVSSAQKEKPLDFNKSNALIIVDGLEITKAEMEKIKPESIESISVLKGESATKLYGEKGKEGVVLITLKKVDQNSASIHLQTDSPLKFENSGNPSKQPLFVKDGVILDGMIGINNPPESIESIDVLKGESATKLFGDKGKNGVVLITSKKVNTKENKSVSEPIPVQFNGFTSDQKVNSLTEGFGKNSLLVIDGVISDMQSPDKFPTDSIASISMLKGEAATILYGDKGKNGVVLITSKKSKAPFTVVEALPEYPGGTDALNAFVYSTMKYPVIALENGIHGQVLVNFIVAKNGAVTKVKISKSVDPSLDKEAKRIVEAMPKWTPGQQNGETVDVTYSLPINFKLPEEKPLFPGGMEAMNTFIYTNMKYPEIALKKGIQGKVIVGFAVNKVGEIKDVYIKSGVDPSLDNEAIRIIKSMPRWTPGKQNGEAIDFGYLFPINFKLPTDYHPKNIVKLKEKK